MEEKTSGGKIGVLLKNVVATRDFDFLALINFFICAYKMNGNVFKSGTQHYYSSQMIALLLLYFIIGF